MTDNSEIHNIHDNYFKFILSRIENVRTLSKEFFPEIVSHIDLDTMEISPTEKISSEIGKRSYLNFAIRCTIKGKPSRIYFVLEDKSNPDKRVIVQLVRYVSSEWEEDIVNGKELKPVLARVFYKGKRRWNIETDTVERFKDLPEEIRRYLLGFRYMLFAVSNL